MRAYRIAYDGRDYHGFQRQPDVPTISDAILDALRDLDVLAGEDAVPAAYAAAGRTDAGVSAVAQTVAFEAPDWLTPAALNAELPADVRAWGSTDVDADFHATHDATQRTYTYYLHAPDAADGLVREAVQALSGRNDYHNLTPDADGTVRAVTIDVDRDGSVLVLTVEAGGFPRQLVRRLVTVIDDLAHGERDRSFLGRVLGLESLDGPDGVGPAPAEPLVLTDVTYPGQTFEVDSDAAASAGDVFGARQITHATAARVCGTLAAVRRPGRDADP